MIGKLQNNRAFTLIEVVIVIAIGALIILVVLQAVSNAQESQRDSTRRQEASQISAALEQFAANNQGEYPGDASILNSRVINGGYVSETVSDKWDGAFQPGAAPSGSNPNCEDLPSTGHYGWYEAVTPAGGGNPRDYNLWVCLEQGNQPVRITQDDA